MTAPAADRIRIYGDNIIECKRALLLITQSLGGETVKTTWLPSPLYAPKYRLQDEGDLLLDAELLPGYGRWKYDIQEHMRSLGASLREAADAVVVRLTSEADGEQIGAPVVAFEFCGALPAGNNAWQRCGRALACAEAGIPYLYFAELGGAELNADRIAKAARFPNPLVPFGYLTLGLDAESIALPVFGPSPSISVDMAKAFAESFGEAEARAVVRAIFREKSPPREVVEALEQKAARTTQALADLRRRADSLKGDDWTELATRGNGAARARWLVRKKMPWLKKVGIDGRTETLPDLLRATVQAGAVAVGSRDMPLCLLSAEGRGKLAQSVAALFRARVSTEFIQWLGDNDKPLVVIWVAGFKPRGDDSRPDRGLVAFARMLFGDTVQYLTVIYGPATQDTWQRFATDLPYLARTNGLWEAIVAVSDAILVDSSTAGGLRSRGVLVPKPQGSKRAAVSIRMPETEVPAFGEHDVDTVLHTLFTNAVDLGVFEGMCNPPGGDWSGISFQSAADGEVVRWTSLPRVSGVDSKRPDHAIIFYGTPPSVMVAESKDTSSRVEAGIGPRLTIYLQNLLKVAPNVIRTVGARTWGPYSGPAVSPIPTIISAAAFPYTSVPEMRRVLQRANVDAVLAVEFVPSKERVLLHVLTSSAAKWFPPKLAELSKRFAGRMEAQVH